jgi:hypothetical protein
MPPRFHRRIAGDRRALDGEVAQLGQREDAEDDRHQRNAVLQVEQVAGPAHLPGLRVGADHADQDAETGGDDAP